MAVAPAPEQALVDRVQELTQQLEQIGDPFARAAADDLATAIIQMYGEGLERIFAAVPEEIRDELAADGVVASLMLIHGLYPVALETRVREALDIVRPYLESHGGDIELLEITADGVARLRLRGSCDGCAASAATLEAAVERALQESAPDLAGIDVEGAVAPPPARPPAASPEWVPLDGAADIPRGALSAASSALVVANVAGTLLAYRNTCAGCGENLDGGVLLGGTLTCAACGHAFDLPRAGRSTDGAGLQLEPVPLLRSNGTVKVALAL
jgi:Fe-S cluster biogenesis protein NfuA/nitrite reductase/ring-hydroxylating ferredoxin subunit